MKRIMLIAGASFVAVATAISAADSSAAAQLNQQAVKLAKEIQAQQTAISENQAKIDAKVAALAEQVQVAKVFAGRSAGK